MLKNIVLIICVSLFANAASAADITEFELDQPFAVPNMRFIDDQSNIHNLSDYKGKVVLLNFWATWCAPCVAEMPALDNLAKSMIGKDVEIMTVSIDFKGMEAIKEFYRDNDINNLPILMDSKGKAFSSTLKLQVLPTTLVIDRKGMVVGKIMGEIDWDSDAVRKYLLEL